MPPLSVKQSLSDDQKFAIFRALHLGRTLQEELPQIADAFLAEQGYDTIIKHFDIENRYHVTHAIARVAVCRALHGNPNYYADVEPYKGLIPATEKDALTRRHYALAGQRGGEKAVAQKLGIHGMTLEERTAAQEQGLATQRRLKTGFFAPVSKRERKRRGAAGAAQARKLGKGAAYGNISREQKSVYGELGGLARTLQQGQVPWKAEETADAYALWTNPDYRRMQPPKPGHPDLERITREINYRYHHGDGVRSKTAIDVAVRKYRRKHNLA